MAGNGYTEADCLALVERSPAAVAAHDRDAWLGLFASDAVVEDPVGSAPQRRVPGGKDPLVGFYECFIAPNTVRFLPGRDIVCGLHVMRDLSLEITLSPRVTVQVPMHLLYELKEEAGELKIARLAAHWELAAMARQQRSRGIASLGTGIVSTWRLLRHLGPSGLAGFARARHSVGDAGRALVPEFCRRFTGGDSQGVLRLFESPDAPVHFPWAGQELTAEQFVALAGELHADKVIAAGRVVSATLQCRTNGEEHTGVGLFVFREDALTVAELRCYW